MADINAKEAPNSIIALPKEIDFRMFGSPICLTNYLALPLHWADITGRLLKRKTI
jgi:hypothetical protein